MQAAVQPRQNDKWLFGKASRNKTMISNTLISGVHAAFSRINAQQISNMAEMKKLKNTRMKSVMIRIYTLPVILLIAMTAVPAKLMAHEPLFKHGVQVFLVRPDGSLLDYIPEYGSVTLGEDNAGRPTLLDHQGRLVATEMTARELETYRSRVDNNASRSAREPGGWSNRGAPDRAPARPSRPQSSDQILRPPFSATPEPEQDYNQRPAPQRPSTASIFDMNVVALQVYLDRAGFSPGVIDGHMGDNVQKALTAYHEATGETLDADKDREKILASLSVNGGLPVTTYRITDEDAAGPYLASIPSDYSEKARLEHLSYTSVNEMLAEKFHMDERLLKRLNPEADFTRPGTTIKVIAPGAPKRAKVSRIIADKTLKQVRAYDESGQLVAAYPATIGSSDTPSPSGTVTIERIAIDPNYTYNPKKNFQQGNNNQVLTINPGPNGPVGNVWIALSKPSYGIHGTPEPSKIGKTSSHGCVRLTNWDAQELAGMVSKGVTVVFTP